MLSSALIVANGLIALSGYERGTTAIAVWTPRAVVIAADGKVTRRNDPHLSSYETCKTRAIGAFIVTAAGFYGRQAAGYDVWAQIASILTASRDLTIQQRRIVVELRPILERGLEEARRRDRAGFARDFPSDYLAIAVASIEDGRPRLATVDFYPQGRGQIGIDVKRYPPPDVVIEDDDIGLSVMGIRREELDVPSQPEGYIHHQRGTF
jgi:hypothetical protein